MDKPKKSAYNELWAPKFHYVKSGIIPYKRHPCQALLQCKDEKMRLRHMLKPGIICLSDQLTTKG